MLKRTGIHKKGEISFESLLQFLHKNPRLNEAGGIACFIGIVRGFTSDGKGVKKLVLETYKERAEGVLAGIADDLRSKPGIVDVLIHHLVGVFDVGEDLVYVVVAGKSRRNIFPVLMEAVERYKHEAPIWKKEYLENGAAHWFSEG